MWIYRIISPMKTGQKIRKNNRGFTLVEIILVLGIGALLAGVSLTGLNYLKYGNTRKCAERLLDKLDEVQVENMTREGITYLGIFKEGDALYVQKLKLSEPGRGDVSTAAAEKIAEKSIELKWSTGEDTDTLDETELLLVSFSKATGAYRTEPLAAGGRVYAGDFWICGRGIFHIVQVAETGKHYIEE